MFVVLLWIYINTEQAENMPDHESNRQPSECQPNNCFPLGGILRADRHFRPKLCSNEVESSSTFSVAREMSLRAQNSS